MIFLILLMSLMKNKLELVRLSNNIENYSSNGKCTQNGALQYLLLSLILNIILILSTTKKVSKLSFCSRFKIYVLMFSKLLELLLFTIKKKGFLQSNKFSLIKKFFHSQRKFLQRFLSRKCSTKYLIKKIFHSQGIFLQNI